MPVPEIISCGRRLMDKKLTLSVAESATAGYLAAAFSLVPDAGKFFKGGIICYDACVKKEVLSVSPGLIDRYTAESAEATMAIAKGIHKVIPADICIGITGLVRPGGSESEQKPVGTMFICILHNGTPAIAVRHWFKGEAIDIIRQTISETGKILKHYLEGNSSFT